RSTSTVLADGSCRTLLVRSRASHRIPLAVAATGPMHGSLENEGDAMLLLRLACFLSILALLALSATALPEPPKRPRVAIRGIYGGVPTQIFDRGRSLADYGVNGIWIGSGSVTRESVEGLKAKSPGVKVFAEFNTMHEAGYLKEHPDARPVGPDGRVAPPPDGWQGVCPSHPGYRRYRMEAFRQTLRAAPIDGIWLDYHHAQASWEQARPNLPDTCFCDRCLSTFAESTGIVLPDASTAERARRLLGPDR